MGGGQLWDKALPERRTFVNFQKKKKKKKKTGCCEGQSRGAEEVWVDPSFSRQATSVLGCI